jgi:nucleotide-binding universal stress UspA family protein
LSVGSGGRAGSTVESLVPQVEQVRESEGTITETHLRIGSPPYEVVGLTGEIGVGLILVGSGRPRAVRRAVSETMRRAAIGAAADYIVRSAHCPVLLVRGDGVLRGLVPHPDARDVIPEGEPEAIGDRREQDRL